MLWIRNYINKFPLSKSSTVLTNTHSLQDWTGEDFLAEIRCDQCVIVVHPPQSLMR